MATLRSKRKLAAVSRETIESTKNSRSHYTLDSETAQEYISQVSEETEGRVTEKLSKEFNRTESRIVGALSKLDEFLLNPQVRICSVAVPGTSRNSNSENREPNGDRSSDDPCPEVRFSSHHSGHLNSSEVEEYPHTLTAVGFSSHDSGNLNNPEVEDYTHIVTGVGFEPTHPKILTGNQEEIPYWSPGTSSGKQKKARSTGQPQGRSENTRATIKADQILLALQQLATNSNSDNFNNNIKRISKLPKIFTTTMPTFNGKSEKFELFGDLFQTSLKIHNELTEEDKISYFHSLRHGGALQISKNITIPKRESLGEIRLCSGENT